MGLLSFGLVVISLVMAVGGGTQGETRDADSAVCPGGMISQADPGPCPVLNCTLS
jgi:hypothetical protein